MANYGDRRSSKRIQLVTPCVFYLEADECSGTVKDLSRDGLCIVLTDVKYRESIGNVIRFQFMDGPTNCVTGTARIVRSKVIGDCLELGCKILRISPADFASRLETREAVEFYQKKNNERKVWSYRYE